MIIYFHEYPHDTEKVENLKLEFAPQQYINFLCNLFHLVCMTSRTRVKQIGHKFVGDAYTVLALV